MHSPYSLPPLHPCEGDTDNPYFIGLFYDEERNVFEDEGGYVVGNVLDFVTPNDLYLFRIYKRYMIFRHRSIRMAYVELFWPEDHDN